MWLFQKAKAPFVYMWHVWDIPPKLFQSIYMHVIHHCRSGESLSYWQRFLLPFLTTYMMRLCVCMQMVHIWYKHMCVYCMCLWELRGQEFKISFQVWPIVPWGPPGAALFLQYFWFWHFTVLTFELTAQNHDGSWRFWEIKLFQDRVFCHALSIPQVSQSYYVLDEAKKRILLQVHTEHVCF